MASITTNSMSWTVQISVRSRLFTFALSASERSRGSHRRSYHHRQSYSYRHFSSQPFRRAEAATAPSSNATPASRPPATTPSPQQTTTTSSPPVTTRSPQATNPSTIARPPTLPRVTEFDFVTAHRYTPPQPPPQTTRQVEQNPPQEPLREIQSSGLSDLPATPDLEGIDRVDWTSSFHGLSAQAFSKEAQEVLLQPIDPDDIEVKPDGIIYLPEIKYRRILNKAFGPGAWGLAPRGETIVTTKAVTREYALLANGRLVSIARGEQGYFDPDGIPTATEGCKSNALMRCCKDLGIASELWDPRFIRKYMAEHAKEVWVEHLVTKKRKKVMMRKDDTVRYPHKEVKMSATGAFGL